VKESMQRWEMECPSCAEIITVDSATCRFCGAAIPTAETPTPETAVPPLGFGAAISTCVAKYALFKGRASRAEFWYFVLFHVAVVVALTLVATLLFGNGSSLQAIVFWLSILALIVPAIAVTVRRLHDVNRSGWWYWIVLTVVGVLVLVVWLCEPGRAGDNKYGSPAN
jgi:uncharacterized membrane protein YhaH (DUF805 family)